MNAKTGLGWEAFMSVTHKYTKENISPSAGPSEDIQLFCASTLELEGTQRWARQQAEAVASRQQLSSHGHQGGTEQGMWECEGDEVLCVLLMHSLAGPPNMLSQIVCAQQDVAWRDVNHWVDKWCYCLQDWNNVVHSSLKVCWFDMNAEYLHMLAIICM